MGLRLYVLMFIDSGIPSVESTFDPNYAWTTWLQAVREMENPYNGWSSFEIPEENSEGLNSMKNEFFLGSYRYSVDGDGGENELRVEIHDYPGMFVPSNKISFDWVRDYLATIGNQQAPSTTHGGVNHRHFVDYTRNLFIEVHASSRIDSSDSLPSLDELMGQQWFARLTEHHRRSIASKGVDNYAVEIFGYGALVGGFSC